jgi:hypothetical protein
MVEWCSLAVQIYGVLSEPVLIRIGEQNRLEQSKCVLYSTRESLEKALDVALKSPS